MPQNHENTKSHEKNFEPIGEDLKLADKRLGYLINFNVVNIEQGIKRFVL